MALTGSSLPAASSTENVTFVVNSFQDTIDANPGDGIARDEFGATTLRAAIMEANALGGTQAIELSAGTYALSLDGSAENDCATGDLDINQPLRIIGVDASQTIIDATGLDDRIFDIRASVTTELQGLTLTGGQINGVEYDLGGAIRIDFFAPVTISDCILANNSSPRTSGTSAYGTGGAIYSSGELMILNSRFENNLASNSGGAIYVGGTDASAVIQGCTFWGNSARDGGAIMNQGLMTIERTFFTQNTAGTDGYGNGGAIENNMGGDLTLTNCTISGNSAQSDGGGILNYDRLIVHSSTIAQNTASSGGGLRNWGAASLENAIASNNLAPGTGPDVAGTVTSVGYNLIGNTTDSVGFGALGDLLNVDPMLGPLADNGGPTQTHALRPGSPAIDAANTATSPTTDQRGVARPQGTAADIGAFEYVGSGVIRGSKWNDADRDGLWDPGEPGLAGWTIFLDEDRDGRLDAGEASTTTDANGDYAFTDLAPRTYTVAEVNQSGWLQTSPMTTSGGTGQLTFLHAFRFDQAGIQGVVGVSGTGVISPDGNHVYAPSFDKDSLAVFSRNAQTGELAFVQLILDGQGGVDTLDGADTAVFDAEGRHLYVAASYDNTITVFDRDVVTGQLTLRQSLKDEQGGVDGLNRATDITISPDGQHVYVCGFSDNAVALFQRNPSTGQLSFVEMIKNGQGGVTGLAWPSSLKLSPDGRHAYVYASFKDIVRFNRDTTTGRLSFVGTMTNAGQLSGNSISSDGAYVYAYDNANGRLVVYSRNSVSGALTSVQTVQFNDPGVYGLSGVASASVGPDGKYVFAHATTENTLAVFERDVTTGRLSFVQAVNGTGIPLFSPDAKHVYMSDNGGSVFSRDLGAIQPVSHSVTLGAGQLVEDVDFGNWSGVNVTESGARTDVIEGGMQDTYELALLRHPDAAVEITVTADSQTEVSLDGVRFQHSVTFTRTDITPQTITVRAVDDAMAESNHASTIRHAITGAVGDPNYPLTLSIDNVTVHVADNDDPALTLSIAADSISEGNGVGATTVTVTRNTDPTAPLLVFLSSNDASEAAVPMSVTIPAGQMSATLNIDAVNDGVVDGPHTVTVTARAAMWPKETVDSLGDVGAWTSLALDDANQPRIAYEGRSGRDLKYARYDDDRWNVETVDGGIPVVGQYASLALDTQGRPHIAYQNFDASTLGYAYHNGTSWQLETAAPASDLYISLAVNSQDRPLISSFNTDTFDLSVAERGDISWTVSKLSDPGALGYYTSIVVDANDNPWISFVNATRSELILARRVAGVWQLEIVDSGSSFGDTSLALDTFGRPHISYYDGTPDDLKYAYYDGTAWHYTSVDTQGDVGAQNSLALDSASRPCITYTSPNGVKFAHFDGTRWLSEVIAASGGYPSLAVTSDDRAVVAYYDTVTKDLLVTRQVVLEAATDTVEVTDDDVLTLTLSLAVSSIPEAAGPGATTATVTRNDGDLSSPLTVNLFCDDVSEALVPTTVVIPAGQASATFAIDAVDDDVIDGTQSAKLTATAAGYASGLATLEVTNDDGPRLVLTIAADSISETDGVGATTATLTRNADTTDPLVVALSSSDASEASVPRFVTIPAGKASVQFAIDAVDDPLVDGTQTVTISAGASDQLVPDRNFGNAGSIVVSGTSVRATARQADGKIVAVGNQGALFWAARYDSDGSLDSSFAEEGVFTSDLGTRSPKGYAVRIQGDGKIVVGGVADNPGYNYDFLLVRFNSNGTLDPSFGGDGVVTSHFGGSGASQAIHEIAILPNGKILAAGESSGFALARYNANGSLDTSFGTNGVVITSLTGGLDYPYAMAVQSDGSVILGGVAAYSTAPSTLIGLAKFTFTGALDTTFGTGGKVTTNLAGDYDWGYDLALQADNKIVLVGRTAAPGTNPRDYDFVALRYNTNGTLDTTFGTGGVARTDFHSGSSDTAMAVALQADGKIVVAGTSDGRAGYIRYNTDGSVDVADFCSSTGTSAQHVVIHPDGTLLIAGSKGTADGFIERYRPVSLSFPAAVDTVEVTDDDVLTLTLTIDATSISENGGPATAMVTRNDADLSRPLTVLLASSDSNEAAVPASVTIPSGSASATFPVTAVDDVHPEPTHTVTITASSTDYVQDSVSLKVIDDEGLMLTVSIDTASISEKGGLTTATVTRNDYDLANPLVVSLASSDTTEATLPTRVTIPAGSASATFKIAAADDLMVDGLQTVTITATAAGHTSGTTTFDVLDDETPRLVLAIGKAFISEGAGEDAATATLTRNTDLSNDLVVNLASDDATEATAPTSVTIPAGQVTVSFSIAAVDDAIVDGTQTVTITASAAGFMSGTDAVGVVDNDMPLPDINIKGNGRVIAANDRFPSPNDHTHFGKVDLAGSPVARTFTIENLGDGNLDLSGSVLVQIVGAAAGDFTITSMPAASVDSQSSATFDIQFKPSAPGLRSATVVIASNDPDESSYEFSIQGIGKADFGDAGQRTFEFVSVLDTTTMPGVAFQSWPDVNNAGEIAVPVWAGFTKTLYVGDADGIRPLLQDTIGLECFLGGFNDAGQAALRMNGGGDDDGMQRVLLIDGDVVTTIQQGARLDRWAELSLNDLGEVAYFAGRVSDYQPINYYTDGSLEAAVDCRGLITILHYKQNVSLNNNGQIAFTGWGKSSPAGTATPGGFVYDAATGAITRFADCDSEYEWDTCLAPTINDSGEIAYIDQYGSREARLWKKDGDELTLIAQAGGEFLYVFDPVINNNGEIVFSGALATRKQGLFVGPNPLADRVIVEGDSLFGSTLLDMEFYRGFNDHGQVAFTYHLANGVYGVALATPTYSYSTRLADNGAWHIATGPMLGAVRDIESEGQCSTLAVGDAGATDDDGVTFTSPLIPGADATLAVTASDAGFLNAWVDFNGDGDWDDSGEQIFADRLLTTGDNNLSFSVPVAATVTDCTFARFRFNSTGGLSFVGGAEDGEVEDYRVQITAPSEIHGTAWNDLDGDGIRDPDEPGLAGVTIYLDRNDNRQFDAGDMNAVTASDDPGTPTIDEAGTYVFNSLAAGTYRVAEVVQNGWMQTSPDPSVNTHLVTLVTGEIITDINFGNRAQTPPVAVDDAYQVDEDVTLTILAPGILANDSDAEEDPLSALLVADPSHGTLTLNVDGSFTYRPAADYSGTDSFTYKVHDGHEDSSVATVSITVQAVNDSPTDLLLSQDRIAETTTAGSVVGLLTTTDPDPGDTFTYALVPGEGCEDNASFTIDDNRLKTVAAFDFETNSSYSIRVRTTDQLGLWYEEVFTLTVTDVNEPPTVALTNTMSTLAENVDTSERIAVATIVVADDALGINALSVGGADAALFEIDGEVLYLKAGTVLDLETQGQLVVTVEVDDESIGTTFEDIASLTITIDPPTGEIRGALWNDLDGDGVWDTEEAGLANWQVYLDLNTNGQFDDGELTTTTEADGSYVFTGLPYGTYTVAEVRQSGWLQTSPSLRTDPIEQVTIAPDELLLFDCTGPSSISADGRYVPFCSDATNLVPGDTNGFFDVFVYDGQTNTTERVSLAFDGAEANGDCHYPAISADGRYVAFYSSASNLVPGDTNGCGDVFVYDRQTDTTERVSLASDGAQANSGSGFPSISDDGRYVAFVSAASTLVPGDTNGLLDIFVYDRQTDTIERVSVTSDGTEGNGGSTSPTISADGRYVAFDSDSENLVPGDTNGERDVFVYDRQTGTIERVSTASDGTEGNGNCYCPSISADGRYVAFHSASDNLVPGDTNGHWDAFVYDRQKDVLKLVSIASDGSPADGDSSVGSISADGRYVAFQSFASNLLPGGSNGWPHVFVYDCQTDTIERLTTTVDGSLANGHFYLPVISADGRYVAFQAHGSDLVSENASPYWEVFVASTAAWQPGTYAVVLAPGQVAGGIDFGNHVQTVPAAVDDAYQVDENPLTILGPGVLTNDADAEGDPMSALLVAGPSHGLLTLNLDGSFTYRPAAGFSGLDSFTYKVHDGHEDSNVATVVITVQPVNDPPTVSLDNMITVLPESLDTTTRIKVAEIVVVDDTLGSNELSLSGADADLFEIEENTLYLKAGTVLDYATTRRLQVTVEVDDPSLGTTAEDAASLAIDLPQLLGSLEFLALAGLDLSAADQWYVFQATREGYLTIDGTPDVELALYGDDLEQPPVAVATLQDGRMRLDVQAVAGETYYLKASGSGTSAEVRLANLVQQTGDTVTVFGTDGDDTFGFDASASRWVEINGLAYVFTDAEAAAVAFDGGEGADTAMLTGSAGDETAELHGTGGTLTGPEYTVTVTNVAQTTVIAGEGTDTANLADSDGDDTFEGGPTESRLFGTGFDLRAQGFDEVSVTASKGTDTAKLYDSDGDDTFQANSTWWATLKMADASLRLNNFDEVVAHATAGGNDVAWLYDSAGDDTFDGGPTSSVLAGTGFRLEASSFDEVHAIADKGGTDKATIVGSTGNERLVGWTGETRLYGGDYYVRSQGFDEALVKGGGGTDKAELYDSKGDDIFQAAANWWATVKTGNTYLQADGFARVQAFAKFGGNDVAWLNDSPGSDTFDGTPTLSTLAGTGFHIEAHNFEEVHAIAEKGGTDKAAIVGSTGNERLVGWTGETRLYGGDYYVRSRGFGEAIVKAGGGYDVAELYDSAGDDTFQAAVNWWATVKTGNTYLRADGFDQVQAFAKFGGNDVAWLNDSAGDDTFEGSPTLSTLAGAGFRLEAHTFEYVHAIAEKGGTDKAAIVGSTGNEHLVGWTGETRLYGGNYYLRSQGFGEAIVTAGGGYDTAELYDSKGDDTFQAAANWWATVKTGNTFLRADGFDQVQAIAKFGGNDVAWLNDSAGDDIFEGSPTLSTLAGPGFRLEAHTFEEVHAVAQKGGTDTATFADTTGDERLVTWTGETRLYGSNYYLRAQGFDQVYVTSSGGTDTAELHGSGGDDLFVSNGSTSSLTGSGYSLETTDFDELEVFAGGGTNDRAELSDAGLALDALPDGITPNYLAWLREFEEIEVKREPPKEDETYDAKDKLFATWWV